MQNAPPAESISAPAQAPVQPQPEPQPEADLESIFIASAEPAITQPNYETSIPAPQPTEPITPPNLTDPQLAPTSEAAVAIKKGGSIKLAIFGLVAFVFLIVYIFFWTRFFNLKLPF
jgi:hypothetical protein